MTEPIRVGIVGTGGIARGQHIPSYEAVPGFRIVAACDVNADALEMMADQHDIPATYADYREMLAKEKLDLISICTSNDMHYPVTMAAIEAGIDIYCEKPLAMTVAEAREMTEAAAAKGLCTGVNFSHRRTPAARLAQEILSTGALGEIYYVSAVYAVGNTGYAERKGTWRNQKEKAGYGGMGDMGAHIINMLQWWLDAEVTEVAASMRIFVPERVSAYDGSKMKVTSEDQGTLLVNWSNGAQGYICGSYSFTGRGYDQRIEIYGADGGIMYDQHRPLELDVCLAPEYTEPYTVLRKGGSVENPYATLLVPPEHWGQMEDSPRRKSVLVDWLEAYKAGKPCLPDFAAGLAVQQVLEGARIADEERRWVSLPL